VVNVDGVDSEKAYDFGVWDIHGVAYDRWSINFFVTWGRDIIAARPIAKDDEQHLSANYPKSIRKRTPRPSPPPLCFLGSETDGRLCCGGECFGGTFLVLLAK
jgi:hypothetical protein